MFIVNRVACSWLNCIKYRRTTEAAEGESYTIYLIFTLTFAEDQSAYSYKVTDEWADFFADGAPGTAYVTLDQRGYVTANTIEGQEQAFAKAALSYAKTQELATIDSIVADGSGSVIFTDLPIGYYLVDTTQGSLCALTSTDPEAVIEEKWTAPTLEKEIREDDHARKTDSGKEMHAGENTGGDGWGTWNDADNRQTLTYRLTLRDISGALNLTVHDYLESGLAFTGIERIVLYQDQEDTEGQILQPAVDYVLTETACSGTADMMASCSFEVHFVTEAPESDYHSLTRLFDDLSDEAYLVITCQASTDTHPGHYADYHASVHNHACLSHGAASHTSETITETDLFGFGIYKYTEKEEEKTALAGVTFTLSKGTGENTQYATFTSETSDTDSTDYYLLSGWTSEADAAGVLTSGSDGMIRIVGLDDDTYLLTEEEALHGYNPLADPLHILIEEDGKVTFQTTGSDEQKEAAGHVVPVENHTGSLLPGTGGRGTALFYLAGVILVLGAGVFLITRRRMNRGE